MSQQVQFDNAAIDTILKQRFMFVINIFWGRCYILKTKKGRLFTF